MTWILLEGCVLVCLLVMGLMMVSMRRGTPLRKRRSKRSESDVGSGSGEAE